MPAGEPGTVFGNEPFFTENNQLKWEDYGCLLFDRQILVEIIGFLNLMVPAFIKQTQLLCPGVTHALELNHSRFAFVWETSTCGWYTQILQPCRSVGLPAPEAVAAEFPSLTIAGCP